MKSSRKWSGPGRASRARARGRPPEEVGSTPCGMTRTAGNAGRARAPAAARTPPRSPGGRTRCRGRGCRGGAAARSGGRAARRRPAIGDHLEVRAEVVERRQVAPNHQGSLSRKTRRGRISSTRRGCGWRRRSRPPIRPGRLPIQRVRAALIVRQVVEFPAVGEPRDQAVQDAGEAGGDHAVATTRRGLLARLPLILPSGDGVRWQTRRGRGRRPRRRNPHTPTPLPPRPPLLGEGDPCDGLAERSTPVRLLSPLPGGRAGWRERGPGVRACSAP